MPAGFEVSTIIVGFGHSDDFVKCLNAIATQRRCPKFEVSFAKTADRLRSTRWSRRSRKRAPRAREASNPSSPRRASSCGRVDYGSPGGRRLS